MPARARSLLGTRGGGAAGWVAVLLCLVCQKARRLASPPPNMEGVGEEGKWWVGGWRGASNGLQQPSNPHAQPKENVTRPRHGGASPAARTHKAPATRPIEEGRKGEARRAVDGHERASPVPICSGHALPWLSPSFSSMQVDLQDIAHRTATHPPFPHNHHHSHPRLVVLNHVQFVALSHVLWIVIQSFYSLSTLLFLCC